MWHIKKYNYLDSIVLLTLPKQVMSSALRGVLDEKVDRFVKYRCADIPGLCRENNRCKVLVFSILDA